MDEPRPRGPCCACGRPFPAEGTVNVVMLDRRGPEPGKGWGCVVCGLPSDGAVAVVCDTCVLAGVEAKWAVVGYALDPGRVAVEVLTEPHAHDVAKHADDDAINYPSRYQWED